MASEGVEHSASACTEDIITQLPQIQQHHDWDCGLACTLMVLSYHRKTTDDFHGLCQRLGFGESVWTIDLACIMKHYNLRHLLCTVTMGVDRSYSKQSFYKAKFTTDEIRVNKLFEEREALELSVEERSVSMQEIYDNLLLGHLVIVLVDWNILCHKLIKEKVKCFAGMSCIGKCNNMYQGHFIVVCGYSEKKKMVYFRNPATSSSDLCRCSVKVFDSARKGYGTDEDLLFIFKD